MIDKINHFVSKSTPFFFLVDFDAGKGLVMTTAEADVEGIKFSMNGNEVSRQQNDFKFEIIQPSAASYNDAFETVMYHLKRGDSYLLNLTFPSLIKTDLDLETIYSLSDARYKLLVPGKFVVFSPEIFVKTDNGRICSYPMKGTISADIPDAENVLLSDRKEFFEHNTIVDLIRNDLSMVSHHVEVTKFRYIEKLTTNRGDLLQMSSEISGILPEDYLSHLGEIIFRLLPAGSVTGAPKERTVEIIKEVEQYERGFYTGIFGYFDGKELDSAVTIRYIEQTASGLVFKSGGGITALSNMENEYRELISKVYVPFI